MARVPFEQITSGRVRHFDAYWRSKWVAGRMPGRSAIDPSEIRDLLPFLVIVDIERNPFRVRYRLCGTMVQKYDEELTGQYLDQLVRATDASKAEIGEIYRRAADDGVPQFGIHEFISRTMAAPLDVQAGVWPLLGAGGIIDQCVAIEDYINL
jgi:hypothetical protein